MAIAVVLFTLAASACSSGLALSANAAVLACLWRHRSEDINMRLV
jgi:hypothetical protein